MSTVTGPRLSLSQRILVLAAVVAVAVALDAIAGGFGDEPGVEAAVGAIVGALMAWWGPRQGAPEQGLEGWGSFVYNALLVVAILGSSTLWDGASLFFAGFALSTAVYETWARQRRR